MTFHTPPAIAKLLGVHPAKVLAWITRGELHAVNIAENPNGRPRYRIAHAELMVFLERRGTRPAVKSSRRKRTQQPEGWVKYY